MVDILVHSVGANSVGADTTQETLGDALKKITPSIVLVGIAMGGAAAIGSGAVNKWLWKK